MIGPHKKKMPDRDVCMDCDALIVKGLPDTKLFPARTVHYCSHKMLANQVAFIKGYPYTPKWCPAK